jgi:hypothetical protein
MLGRLEMTVEECIAEYSALAAMVFGEKVSSAPFNFKFKVKARFDSTKLERAIVGVLENAGQSKTDLLNDGVKRGCRT